MPRNGDGSGDNGPIETGENLVHGVGAGADKASTGVDRSNKAAPMPSHEAGEALEGMNASGGGNKTEGSGKGPLEPAVEVEAKK